MGIWYAAVEDDPLTSGPGGRVYANGKVGTIKGDDGRYRRMAFIGDEAWCAACRSIGVITYGTTGLREVRRMLDLVNGGRRQAVGGDIVLCKCPVPPHIIAQYGRKWQIHDQDGAPKSANLVSPTPEIDHWISFVLKDKGTCDGLKCIAHFADGTRESGTFDSDNQVRFKRAKNGNPCQRIELVFEARTDAAESVALSILTAAE